MLTNQKYTDFTITELEVWEVQFLVIHYIKSNKFIGLIDMRRHRDRDRQTEMREKRENTEKA